MPFYILRGKFVLEGWWTIDAADPENAEQLLTESLPSDLCVEESETTTSVLGELLVEEYYP